MVPNLMRLGPAALAVSLLLQACTEAPSPTAPGSETAVALAPAPMASSGTLPDSVSWNLSNELIFTDDNGDDMRWKRFGHHSAPTRVEMYKNGVLEGEIRFDWSGGTATVYEWEEYGGEWVSTDANAELLDSELGDPNELCEVDEEQCCDGEIDEGPGGGDDGPGGDGCGGAQLNAVFAFDLATGEMLGDDEGPCDDEIRSFKLAAVSAIAGGAVTGGVATVIIVTKAPLGNILRRAAAVTAGLTLETVRRGQVMMNCLFPED